MLRLNSRLLSAVMSVFRYGEALCFPTLIAYVMHVTTSIKSWQTAAFYPRFLAVIFQSTFYRNGNNSSVDSCNSDLRHVAWSHVRLAVSTFYCLRRIWGTLFVFIRYSLRSERRTALSRGHVRLSICGLGGGDLKRLSDFLGNRRSDSRG